MSKNLSNSQLDRQNILNNPFAIEEITNKLEIKGIILDEQIWLTTKQVANYFEVDLSTIKRYLENYEQELRQNGYKIFTGKELEIAKNVFGKGMDELSKTTVLRIIDFSRWNLFFDLTQTKIRIFIIYFRALN